MEAVCLHEIGNTVPKLPIHTHYISFRKRKRQGTRLHDWLREKRAHKGHGAFSADKVGMAGGNLPNSTRYISRHYICPFDNENGMGKKPSSF